MVNNHDIEFSHDAAVRGITMQSQTYEERHHRVFDGWSAIRDSLFATYVAPALHQLCSHCFAVIVVKHFSVKIVSTFCIIVLLVRCTI